MSKQTNVPKNVPKKVPTKGPMNQINLFKKGITDQIGFLKEGPIQNYKPTLSDSFGPTYDYSAEIKTPGEIGIQFGNGSWSGIMNAAAGVDYYSSVLGYGESAGMAAAPSRKEKMSQHPMGLRYFLKTGAMCSNGAEMYQYVNTIPGGIPGRLGKEIKRVLKVNLQGLAPGMFEDTAKALNPAPIFNAVMNTGYASCRNVTLPVGDAEGKIVSDRTKEKTWWIDPSKEKIVNGPDGKPHVSHWIFDSWVTAEQYNKESKVYPVKDANGNIIEAFQSPTPLPLQPQGMGQTPHAPLVAGALFVALFIGLITFNSIRK